MEFFLIPVIVERSYLLNRQFQSVFTTDTDKEMPDIPKEVFKEMPEITITENGVEKLLRNLNPNKAFEGRCRDPFL
jgi:hypothetical protein